MNITPEILYELAKESMREYSIDFGMIQIDEDSALKLICIDVLDKYQESYDKLTNEQFITILLSSICTLILENFSLNLSQLQNQK